MRRFCEARGVPREAWPHFSESIDMNLDELGRKNEEIKRLIQRMAPEDVRSNETLSLIQDGKQFYFSATY